MKVPVVFIIFKRIDTTKKVLKLIHDYKPDKLYLIADGPKVIDDNNKCSEVRNFVENNIDWDCELIKVYSETNLGCAKRVQTGLDYVFENEEIAIILEDDTLPDPSFFNFCEELLERYKDDKRVAHISGCNLHPNAINFKESYCFSSIVNIWGWATWKRAWNNYDINMPSWDNEDKESFIYKWCPDRKSRKGIHKMFDLHCNNEDPWTWDSQWVYACWKMNGLSVVPSRNLVSNLGIGPDASNTKQKVRINMFPLKLDSMTFPMNHPSVFLNRKFDFSYYFRSRPSLYKSLMNKLIKFKNMITKRIINV
jgi:hypothetical protein